MTDMSSKEAYRLSSTLFSEEHIAVDFPLLGMQGIFHPKYFLLSKILVIKTSIIRHIGRERICL